MRRGVCGMMMMSRNTRMSNTQEVGGPKVEKSLQQVGTDSPTATINLTALPSLSAVPPFRLS